MIFVGQKIVLVYVYYTEVGIHTFLEGESLAGIAEGYETTFEVLCALNAGIMNPNSITSGQKIRYPMMVE
jgi:hypothetical protein